MTLSTAEPSRRVALVTGAARGLGYVICDRLASDGFAVIAADINGDAVAQAAERLRGDEREIYSQQVDVADPASVAALMDRVSATPGQLDVLVNSAGILPLVDGAVPPIETLPFDLWQRTLAVNLTGTFLVSQAAIPLLRQSAAGRVILISSRAARMRAAGNAHYSASKAGVIGFARVLAGELGPYGVTVNCLCPSRIDTELNREHAGNDALLAKAVAESPLGRLGTPEDIAAATAYLASHDAAFITGAILDVTGGTFMP